jgi:MioC protein
MLNAGAKLLCPAIHIDVLNHPIPEDAAIEWLKNWLSTNEQSA